MAALGKTARPACTVHGLGYLALALALGLWTARLTLGACGGELTPPLDDTYIYLQYARTAAAGEPFSYQPGAPPTRGATSLLYPFLLAPAARVLDPDHLYAAAWLLGVLLLAGSALAADRWAARRLSPEAGWAAGLLTLLSGHLLWGAVSGMDIALFAFALVAAAAAVPWYLDAPDARRGVHRLVVLSGWLALLGLARPEGLPAAFLAAGAVIAAGHTPNSRRARWALVLAPLGATALTFGPNLLLFGNFSANTLAAKAVWSEQRPDVRAATLRRLPWVLGQITRALFSDFRSPAYGHPTGLVLEALLVIGALWGTVTAFVRRGTGTAGRVLVLMLAAGLAAGLIPVGFNSHHHRYQIPYVPLATLLVVSGWWRLPPRGARRWWRVLPLALVGLLLLPGMVRFGRRVAENAANIHDQQVTAGRWIHDHLPENAVVALNDAGAITYYGGRRVVDLVGLVTNGPALWNRAGPGSLFEWLERLPARERPTHFAIFPSWYPYLRHTSLVRRKIAQFTLGRNTISGSDVKEIFEADWSHVEEDSAPVSRSDLVDLWGFRVTDVLDVADLESQREHDYVAFDTWRDVVRELPVQEDPRHFLIDGGRRPTRGEFFTMRCRSGRPAVLVLRTEAFLPFQLRVEVNGHDLGTWSVPKQPLAWTEPLFQIPADVLTTTPARVRLSLAGEDDRPYSSYHYWLLQ